MTKGLVQFSVIIPTYARPARLAACLKAIANLEYPRDRFEVIVVDDGSPEPLDETVRPVQGELRLTLLRQTNAGPAAARNAGAARASGSHLAFSDDDCEPDPRWLQAMADRFEQTPRALIGGRIVNRLPSNAYSDASQAITDCTYDRMQRIGGERLFATCNIAVSVEEFRQLGGFSTHFPLAAGEDYDFCHRWQRAGLPAIYAPDAIINHTHDLTLWTFLRQHYSYGRGLLQFRRRSSGGVFDTVRGGRISLYLNLLRWPLRHERGLRAWRQVGLIGLSQAATALGAARELIRPAPQPVHPPLNLQKEPR